MADENKDNESNILLPEIGLIGVVPIVGQNLETLHIIQQATTTIPEEDQPINTNVTSTRPEIGIAKETRGISISEEQKRSQYLSGIPESWQSNTGNYSIIGQTIDFVYSRAVNNFEMGYTDLDQKRQERHANEEELNTLIEYESLAKQQGDTETVATITKRKLELIASIEQSNIYESFGNTILDTAALPQIAEHIVENAISIGTSDAYEADPLTRLWNTGQATVKGTEQQILSPMVQYAQTDPVELAHEIGLGILIGKAGIGESFSPKRTALSTAHNTLIKAGLSEETATKLVNAYITYDQASSLTGLSQFALEKAFNAKQNSRLTAEREYIEQAGYNINDPSVTAMLNMFLGQTAISAYEDAGIDPAVEVRKIQLDQGVTSAQAITILAKNYASGNIAPYTLKDQSITSTTQEVPTLETDPTRIRIQDTINALYPDYILSDARSQGIDLISNVLTKVAEGNTLTQATTSAVDEYKNNQPSTQQPQTIQQNQPTTQTTQSATKTSYSEQEILSAFNEATPYPDLARNLIDKSSNWVQTINEITANNGNPLSLETAVRSYFANINNGQYTDQLIVPTKITITDPSSFSIEKQQFYSTFSDLGIGIADQYGQYFNKEVTQWFIEHPNYSGSDYIKNLASQRGQSIEETIKYINPDVTASTLDNMVDRFYINKAIDETQLSSTQLTTTQSGIITSIKEKYSSEDPFSAENYGTTTRVTQNIVGETYRSQQKTDMMVSTLNDALKKSETTIITKEPTAQELQQMSGAEMSALDTDWVSYNVGSASTYTEYLYYLEYINRNNPDAVTAIKNLRNMNTVYNQIRATNTNPDYTTGIWMSDSWTVQRLIRDNLNKEDLTITDIKTIFHNAGITISQTGTIQNVATSRYLQAYQDITGTDMSAYINSDSSIPFTKTDQKTKDIYTKIESMDRTGASLVEIKYDLYANGLITREQLINTQGTSFETLAEYLTIIDRSQQNQLYVGTAYDQTAGRVYSNNQLSTITVPESEYTQRYIEATGVTGATKDLAVSLIHRYYETAPISAFLPYGTDSAISSAADTFYSQLPVSERQSALNKYLSSLQQSRSTEYTREATYKYTLSPNSVYPDITFNTPEKTYGSAQQSLTSYSTTRYLVSAGVLPEYYLDQAKIADINKGWPNLKSTQASTSILESALPFEDQALKNSIVEKYSNIQDTKTKNMIYYKINELGGKQSNPYNVASVLYGFKLLDQSELLTFYDQAKQTGTSQTTYGFIDPYADYKQYQIAYFGSEIYDPNQNTFDRKTKTGETYNPSIVANTLTQLINQNRYDYKVSSDEYRTITSSWLSNPELLKSKIPEYLHESIDKISEHWNSLSEEYRIWQTTELLNEIKPTKLTEDNIQKYFANQIKTYAKLIPDQEDLTTVTNALFERAGIMAGEIQYPNWIFPSLQTSSLFKNRPKLPKITEAEQVSSLPYRDFTESETQALESALEILNSDIREQRKNYELKETDQTGAYDDKDAYYRDLFANQEDQGQGVSIKEIPLDEIKIMLGQNAKGWMKKSKNTIIHEILQYFKNNNEAEKYIKGIDVLENIQQFADITEDTGNIEGSIFPWDMVHGTKDRPIREYSLDEFKEELHDRVVVLDPSDRTGTPNIYSTKEITYDSALIYIPADQYYIEYVEASKNTETDPYTTIRNNHIGTDQTYKQQLLDSGVREEPFKVRSSFYQGTSKQTYLSRTATETSTIYKSPIYEAVQTTAFGDQQTKIINTATQQAYLNNEVRWKSGDILYSAQKRQSQWETQMLNLENKWANKYEDITQDDIYDISQKKQFAKDRQTYIELEQRTQLGNTWLGYMKDYQKKGTYAEYELFSANSVLYANPKDPGATINPFYTDAERELLIKNINTIQSGTAKRERYISSLIGDTSTASTRSDEIIKEFNLQDWYNNPNRKRFDTKYTQSGSLRSTLLTQGLLETGLWNLGPESGINKFSTSAHSTWDTAGGFYLADIIDILEPGDKTNDEVIEAIKNRHNWAMYNQIENMNPSADVQSATSTTIDSALEKATNINYLFQSKRELTTTTAFAREWLDEVRSWSPSQRSAALSAILGSTDTSQTTAAFDISGRMQGYDFQTGKMVQPTEQSAILPNVEEIFNTVNENDYEYITSLIKSGPTGASSSAKNILAEIVSKLPDSYTQKGPIEPKDIMPRSLEDQGTQPDQFVYNPNLNTDTTTIITPQSTKKTFKDTIADTIKQLKDNPDPTRLNIIDQSPRTIDLSSVTEPELSPPIIITNATSIQSTQPEQQNQDLWSRITSMAEQLTSFFQSATNTTTTNTDKATQSVIVTTKNQTNQSSTKKTSSSETTTATNTTTSNDSSLTSAAEGKRINSSWIERLADEVATVAAKKITNQLNNKLSTYGDTS